MRKWWMAHGWAAGRLTSPLLIWAVVTLTLAFAGPFGTYSSFSFLSRIVFWGVPLFVLTIVALEIRRLMCRRLGITDFGRVVAGSAVAVAAVSVPVCQGMYVLFGMRGRVPFAAEVAVFFFLATIGVGALIKSISDGAPPEPMAEIVTEQAEPVAPRLVLRLPEDRRGKLVSVSVRNHYVDVVTELGKSELLLRLGDAIAETDPEPGAQVHRSHWVAWHAVETYQREGQKQFLHLKGGAVIPVSRTYRDLVEERFSGTQMAEDDRHSTASAPDDSSGEKARSELTSPPV